MYDGRCKKADVRSLASVTIFDGRGLREEGREFMYDGRCKKEDVYTFLLHQLFGLIGHGHVSS